MAAQVGRVVTDALTTGADAEVIIDNRRTSLQQTLSHQDHYAEKSVPIYDASHEAPIPESEDEFPVPTEEEERTLRKIAGKVPWIAYTLCVVEFAERASYYGVVNIISNFMEFPLPEGGPGTGATPPGSQETAGALNLGLQTSSAISLLFTFLAYCVPLLGGWVADTYWGRYKTICVGVGVCGVAHLIMVISGIPSLLQEGKAVGPFMLSLFLLAIGAGLFKSNIAPTILDQYQHHKSYVKTLESGERVIVDVETTVQRMMLTFYMLINVGAFFGLATTYAEKDVGYWLAFLLPLIIYLLLPPLLWWAYPRTVKVPPSGSDFGYVLRVLGLTLKKNGLRVNKPDYWDAAKPSVLAQQGITTIGKKPIGWTDSFVVDVSRTMKACQIFAFFVIFNWNDGGIGNIQTSQASSMITNGTPNDLISNFNPLTIIVLIPILNYGLYPLLRKHNIKVGSITLITIGFFVAATSSIVGAILQWKVYETSPCGYYATGCTVGSGVASISIWSQIPLYFLSAMAECFSMTSAYSVAYSRSPPNMKGLVMALFLFTTALSQAIAEALTPVLTDPYLIWPFAATAIAGFVAAAVFYWLYRDLDKEQFLTDGGEESHLITHESSTKSDEEAGSLVNSSTPKADEPKVETAAAKEEK